MLPTGHLGEGHPWDLFFPLGDKQTFLYPIKEGHPAGTSSRALQCGVASLLEGCNSFKERGDAVAGGFPPSATEEVSAGAKMTSAEA